MPGVVQGFERHAGRHGTIPDDGNALATSALHAGGDGHTQGSADGSAGVTNAEGIVFALRPFREAGQAILSTDAVHAFPAPGQDFVGIGLVADVPDQAVFRGIEDVMQGNGQFQDTQAGAEVAACLSHRP